jgi:hypothetical protein
MEQNNRYYEAMEKVKTPIALKEKVGEQIRRQVARRRLMRITYGIGTLAASVALIVGIVFFQRGADGLIITDLVAGHHTHQVYLEDGELNFVLLKEDEFGMPIRLAPRYPIQQQWDFEEYLAELPVFISDRLLIIEGELIAYFIAFGDIPDSIIGEGAYQVDTGGILKISFTDNPRLLPLPIPIEGSVIGQVVVGVGYEEGEGIYHGVFQKDGYIFLLSSVGVEQEQFIYLLHSFIIN